MVHGNVTEVGLINYLIRSEIDVGTLYSMKDSPDFVEFTIPFSSKRKRATSVVKNQRISGSISVFCMGAPEIVIEHCDTLIGVNGKVEALT